MKTISVRDVQERWAETETSLAEEREIVITRDGKPVARLLAVEQAEVEVVEQPRKRFDPEEHMRWMKEFWGDETFDSLTPLLESREERVLISESALAALNEQLDREEREAEALLADSKH